MLIEDAVSKMLEIIYETGKDMSGQEYLAFLEQLMEELNMDKNGLEDELDHREEEG